MNENTVETRLCLSKSTHATGTMCDIAPAIREHPEAKAGEVSVNPSPDQLTWSYLFLHNSKVPIFAEQLQKDGIVYFVHKSVVYQRKKHSRGIQSVEKPTISGLVFMQGSPLQLQAYLDAYYSGYHLVKNCSTHRPAVIPDKVMQPFMRVSEISPERIRFLLHPFKYYAGGHTKLRITSGFLSGLEGYVVRIDRDRRLVMNVGGMSVAISGVHCETFEEVEEPAEVGKEFVRSAGNR